MSVIQKTKHDVYPFISPQHGLKYSAKGKTVLITGAGTGIGKAIAHTFALASAGTLVLAGRRPAPLDAVKASIESATPGCKVLTVPTDVTDQAAVEALFKRAGSVDVLINNAGSAAILKSVVDGDPSGWWKDYRGLVLTPKRQEINVKGVYLCTQAFLRLRSGKGGAIVNVTSLGAVFTSPGMSSYGSSKAALNR
ncbi:MAG: hypothetical protein M1830_000039 [Pleopsidium flavum]|nr:MAG: hypothetical protein M1830_000039 [Pleopsidium flavum]